MNADIHVIPCRIINGEKIKFTLDKPLVIMPGEVTMVLAAESANGEGVLTI